MSSSKNFQRMRADRHLRNSARALLTADIEHLRGNLESKSIASRAVDRLTEGAVDLYEEAVDVANDNKGALAALFAAILVWFARNPIFELLGLNDEEEDEAADGEPD